MDEATNSNIPGIGFAGSAARSGFSVQGPSTVGERRVHAPFSLMTDGTDTFMYVPANSVTINGKAFAPTGLTAHDLTGWYVVTSFTTGLNLYVVFDSTDGQYGKPTAASFGTSAPSGRVITIPILAAATDGLVSIALGAIYHERSSFDGDKSTADYKSIEKATGGQWDDEDHTSQVRNFRAGTEPSGTLFDTEDSYSHKIAVRETDGDGKVDMRWVPDSVLATAVYNQVTQEWDIDDQLSDSFNDWYDSQAEEDKKFWERGATHEINYGASIGDEAKNMVIDMGYKELIGDWAVRSNFHVLGGLSIDYKLLVLNGDGTVTWTTV